MKTPSVYPVLDNRPIDQWKVTELKEELKRRKLVTKGLKEELVRRLNESLQMEMKADEPQVGNGANNHHPNVDVEPTKMVQIANEMQPIANETTNGESEKGDDSSQIDDTATPLVDENPEHGKLPTNTTQIDDATTLLVDDMPQHGDLVADNTQNDSTTTLVDGKPCHGKLAMGHIPEEVLDTSTTSAEMGSNDGEMCHDMALTGQGLLGEESGKECVDSDVQQDSREVRPPLEDAESDLSNPNHQVSEVSPSLGFPVKRDSISSVSVSINEKNDLKDNIIADNVKLDLDVMSEMVQQSSSNVATDVGNSHPMDVDESLGKKASLEETDNNTTSLDMNKKSHSTDLGSSEKLNLDRSSGEGSVGEDALESKHIDSKYTFDEISENSEKSVGLKADEEIPVDVVGDDVFAQIDGVAALAEKRKLPGDEAAVNNEPLKRQRRWKSEYLPSKETHISNLLSSTIPTDMSPSTAVMLNFSRSDSNVNKDAPEERVVPPATEPPTNSLKIDNFLRPFTLKAVQEFLGKTGTVTIFWMDHIKTHCYITYSSVDEARETRNAVYNLRWPPNGGKLLVAEFVDPEEVKLRVEAPPQPPAALPSADPSVPLASGAPATVPVPSPRQTSVRQQTAQQPSLPPPPPLSYLPPGRERLLPPLPPLADKVDRPIGTLDDLFRKTKATPRIYYLPLSEEQVSEKVSEQHGQGRTDGRA